MTGIKISEIKQIADSDVTNLDSFLVLDKETGKTKRLTVQQFTLFTLATLFSSQQGGAFSDKGVLYINQTDFRTDPQQRFVWDYDTGRLGIGTATPEATFDVRGSILLNGYRFSESSTNPRALTIAANSVQNAGAGTIAIGDSIMEGAGSDAVGNIGIGAYALQNNIIGDYNIGIGYNAGKNITGAGNVIIGSYQGTTGDNNIVLSNGQDGVARLLIDSVGNVGIGTTDPGYTLEVVGAISASNYVGIDIDVVDDSSTNSTRYITFASTTAGASSVLADADLTYNPSTDTLTVAQLAGNAATATSASNVAVTNNTSTNATHYVAFVNGASNHRAINVDSSRLTYNPSTNTLTVAQLAGNAATVTNGVYIDETQTITGPKTFSSSIFASSGIYIGGTDSKNHLDLYEEGIFTPVFNFNGTAVTGSSPSQQGVYVKIGRLVYAYVIAQSLNTPNAATNGAFEIGGLPYPPKNVVIANPVVTNVDRAAGHVDYTSEITQDSVIRARGFPVGGTEVTTKYLTWNQDKNNFTAYAAVTYYTDQ